MDERRSPELEALSRTLREVEPPVGAQQRVRRAVEDGLRRRRRRRKIGYALLLIPASAAAVMVVRTLRQPPERPPMVRQVEEARRSVSEAKAKATVEPVKQPEVPTSAPVTEPETQPVPEAAVERPAERSAKRRRVVAKRAQPSPPDAAAPKPAPEPSALSLEVAAYRAAQALQRRDDRAALASFRGMRQRWPQGSLVHEVDLRIIETLLRLRELATARAEARRFLARYPASPKASQVKKILEADGGPGGGPGSRAP